MGISSALGSSALLPAGLGFRNKIINGAMVIAQRGTAAVTGSSLAQYPVDRWIAISSTTNSVTFQQVADAPSGFTYSVKATSGASPSAYTGSQYTFLYQKIEGFNIADLAWGTSSAKPVTLSFWVKVSSGATGTYSVCIENSASTANYIATYTVNAANTWEYKTIFVPGPTSGTFPVDNTTGLQVDFALGIGPSLEAAANTWTAAKYATSGSVDIGALSSATWQVTGVQLEQNYQPTPFEQRPYGVELMLCQRYYEISNGIMQVVGGSTGFGGNTYWSWTPYMVEKRIALNITTSTTANGTRLADNAGVGNQMTYWKAATQYTATVLGFEVYTTKGFGLVFNGGQTDAGLGRFYWYANAEL